MPTKTKKKVKKKVKKPVKKDAISEWIKKETTLPKEDWILK